MVQIHDEQRSIQMTGSHRDTHKNTAQTSTVIINNGSKNSKCRPKSDTHKMKRGSNNASRSNNTERERDGWMDGLLYNQRTDHNNIVGER